jgi:hypothetical protein
MKRIKGVRVRLCMIVKSGPTAQCGWRPLYVKYSSGQGRYWRAEVVALDVIPEGLKPILGQVLTKWDMPVSSSSPAFQSLWWSCWRINIMGVIC